MEVIRILRRLTRHPLLVAFGMVPAAMIGLVLAFDVSVNPPGLASRANQSFTSSARALVQVDDSPTVDLESKASGDLGQRARLIGDLMATKRVHTDTARRMGLAPEQLTVIAPSTYAVEVKVPIAIESNAAALEVGAPHRLLVGADGVIPIVSLKAAAPTRRSSRRLVAAAVASLEDLVVSGGAPGLSVTPLGTPRTVIERQSSKLPVGAAAAIIVFTGWCLGVIILSTLLDRRRARAIGDPRRLATDLT